MTQVVPPIIRRTEARGEARRELIDKQIGKRETLFQLMQSEFGPMPVDILARVEQLSAIDQLDRLAKAVLSSTTIAEMPFSALLGELGINSQHRNSERNPNSE